MTTVFALGDLANVVGDPIGLSVLYVFAMIIWGTLARWDRRAGRRSVSQRVERE